MKKKRVSMLLTLFFPGYKHDYTVDGEMNDEEIEQAKQEMKNMMEKLYENGDAGGNFKLTFSNEDNSNNIYVLHCTGCEYKFHVYKGEDD